MRSSSTSRTCVHALCGFVSGLYSMYVFHEHVLGRVVTSRVRKRKRKRKLELELELELEQSRAQAEKAHSPGGWACITLHYIHTLLSYLGMYVVRAIKQIHTL